MLRIVTRRFWIQGAVILNRFTMIFCFPWLRIFTYPVRTVVNLIVGLIKIDKAKQSK